jgi:hypothetical protein
VRETARDLQQAKLLSRPVRITVGAMCLLALGIGTWAGLRREPDLPLAAAPPPGVKREIEPARPAPPKAMIPKAPTPTVTATTSIAAAPMAPAPIVRATGATPQESRCLSVNALPFAEVYVDDRPVGYTPTACLRVPIGEHRVRFQMDGQRSPERLLRITARHTPDAPMRLSYDFNTGRFIEQ